MSFDRANTFAYGAESNDAQTEKIDTYLGSAANQNSVSNTFAQTGTYSEKLDLTTNGTRAELITAKLATTASTLITVMSGAFALSGAPTSEMGLLVGETGTSGGTAGTASPRRYIRIGTDRKLKIYDKNGNLLAGGTSTTLIPTAGAMKEVVVSFDPLSAATVWIKVYFDGVEELAFDSGLTAANLFTNTDILFFGECLGAGVNRGCSLYTDDAICTYSSSAGDALHLTAYPRLRVAGCVTADAQGFSSAWTPSAGTHYGCITAPGGASLQDAVSGNKDSWKSSTANPTPGGATIFKAQLRWLAKVGGAGKNPAAMTFGAAGGIGTDQTGLGPSATSYTSAIIPDVVKGGVPVRSDADANACEWGVDNSAASSNNTTIDFAPGPEWVYYTSSLPLGTAPPSTGNRRRGAVV